MNNIEINGEVKCIAEWSRISGVNRWTIRQRIVNGWDTYDAVFTPAKRLSKHDLTGMVFGDINVLEPKKESSGKGCHKLWLCRCRCGKEYYAESEHLLKGEITKCRSCSNSIAATRHGFASSKAEQSGDKRLYQILRGMIRRCHNPNSKDFAQYGARGITVCSEWYTEDFVTGLKEFIEWSHNSNYSDGLSIERVDNDKGYSPDNCTWIPLREQCKNKQQSVWVTYNNEKVKLNDIIHLRTPEVSDRLVRNRIYRGWDAEHALHTPPKKIESVS